MPAIAARDYRCSWEIPYDFHPRIHAYPGVTSVVRAYMDGKTAATPAGHEPSPPQPHQHGEGMKGKRGRRKHPQASLLHKSAPRKPDVTEQQTLVEDTAAAAAAAVPPGVSPHAARSSHAASQWRRMPSLPSAPQPSRRRPLWRPSKSVTTTTTTTTAETAESSVDRHPAVRDAAAAGEVKIAGPQLIATTPTTHSSGSATTQLHKADGTSREPSLRSRGFQRPQTRARVVDDVLLPSPQQLQQQQHRSTVVSVGKPPIDVAPSPLSPRTAHTLSSYGSRTKPRFTLAPSFAAQKRQFERQPVPTVTARKRYTTPPSTRELRLNAQRLQHATRRDFVLELLRCVEAQGHGSGVDVVPQVVLDNYGDTVTAQTFSLAGHNFNAVVPDAFECSVEERMARLHSIEKRMWARLIVEVAPLTVAHQEVVDAGGVSVLDSGHVSEPIRITGVFDDPLEREEGEEEVDHRESAMAVVVQPFVDELPATMAEARKGEARRCLPKGREWDRQAAIRFATGPTVQEAIVDLGIDPRYRQPGDFLLQRNWGPVKLARRQ